MQFTGIQVFSFVILLVGTGLIIASIATSSWTTQNYTIVTFERGLWLQCETSHGVGQAILDQTFDQKQNCKNRFEKITYDNQNVKLETDFKAWEIACLALMGSSAVLGLLSLVFSPCCCNRCPCCLVVWVLLATLCCGGGIGTYAYMFKTDPGFKVPGTEPTVYFGWSFWLAVAGCACQFVSTILFGISRARVRYYSHTI